MSSTVRIVSFLSALITAFMLVQPAYADMECTETVIYHNNADIDGISTDGTAVTTSAGFYTGNPRDGQYYVPRSGPSFSYDGEALHIIPTPSAAPIPTPETPPYKNTSFTDLPGSTNKICEIGYARYCLTDSDGWPLTEEFRSMDVYGNNIYPRSAVDGSLCSVIDFNGNVVIPKEQWDFTWFEGYASGLLKVSREREDKKREYTVVNEKLEQLLDKYYDFIYFQHTKDGYVILRDGDKQLLLDSSLNLLADNNYSYVYIYDDMSIRVSKGANKSFLDKEYRELFPIDRYSMKKTDSGQYLVRDCDTNKYALADIDGKVLSEWYDRIDDSAKNGRYIVTENGKKALADSTGKLLSGWHDNIEERFGLIITDNDLVGNMDDSGRVLIEPRYTSVESVMGDYFKFILKNKNELYTDVYDKDGKLIFHGDGVVNYIEGAPLYETSKTVEGIKKYAFMSIDGKLLTDYIYDEIMYKQYLTDAAGEKLCYRVSINGETHFVDESFHIYDTPGKVYWTQDSSYSRDLGDTLYSYVNGKAAVIDKASNSYVVPYTENSGLFVNGDVLLRTENNKTTILDNRGNDVLALDYPALAVSRAEYGLYYVKTSGGSFYIDESGKNLFPRRYTNICCLDENTFAATIGGDVLLLKRVNSPCAVYTDTRMYINGFEIPCYSFNNRTVIKAEDLKGYGFDVIWNGDQQRLCITRNNEYYKVNPVQIPEKGAAGEYFASIITSGAYATMKDDRLSSFSIDGEMLIYPEELESTGITLSYGDKAVYMTVDGLEWFEQGDRYE